MLLEYTNNRSTALFLHKPCGLRFHLGKSAFLAGSRCPLCSPRIELQDIRMYLFRDRDVKKVTEGKNRGTVHITYTDGREETVPYSRIKLEMEAKANVQLAIRNAVKKAVEEKGFWRPSEAASGYVYNRWFQNTVTRMARRGLLIRIGRGKYRNGEEI